MRKEESESLLDLKLACLDDRKRRVGQLVTLFESPNAELVARAAVAASDMPDLEEARTPWRSRTSQDGSDGSRQS